MPLCTIYPSSTYFSFFLRLSFDVRDYDDHERRWTGLDWIQSTFFLTLLLLYLYSNTFYCMDTHFTRLNIHNGTYRNETLSEKSTIPVPW